MYEELKDRGFVVVTAAQDARGAEAAGRWIERANPSYPCLIDTEHRVSELFNMVNVPSAVWIDEDGLVVRPTETAGTGDEFREMGTTGRLSPEAAAALGRRRAMYLDAIRDWVANGTDSRFVPSGEEARRRARAKAPTDEHVRAAALFKLGAHLYRAELHEEGRRVCEEAIALRPESWNFRRQNWNLQAEGDQRSGGPEFWAAVAALGDHWYYEPVDMPDAQPPGA